MSEINNQNDPRAVSKSIIKYLKAEINKDLVIINNCLILKYFNLILLFEKSDN